MLQPNPPRLSSAAAWRPPRSNEQRRECRQACSVFGRGRAVDWLLQRLEEEAHVRATGYVLNKQCSKTKKGPRSHDGRPQPQSPLCPPTHFNLGGQSSCVRSHSRPTERRRRGRAFAPRRCQEVARVMELDSGYSEAPSLLEAERGLNMPCRVPTCLPRPFPNTHTWICICSPPSGLSGSSAEGKMNK